MTTKAPVIKSAKTTKPMIIKERTSKSTTSIKIKAMISTKKTITQAPIKQTDVNVPIKQIVKKAHTIQTNAKEFANKNVDKVPIEKRIVKVQVKQTVKKVPTKKTITNVPAEKHIVKEPVKQTVKKVSVEKPVPAPIKKANAKSAKAKVSRAKTASKEIVVEEDIDEIEEEWKVISGFSKYESSNLGYVRNNNNKRLLKESICDGYYMYTIINDDKKRKKLLAHRITALTWIPNEENKPTVDHINRIRNDNRAVNLRWSTFKEQAANKNYANIPNNSNRNIWKCDLKTHKKIKLYKTAKEAAIDIKQEKLRNTSTGTIRNCLLGTKKSAYGYKWIYDNHDLADLENEEWKLHLSIRINNYYVSNHGRVKNNDRIMTSANENGYIRVKINEQKLFVHRLVAALFVENPNPTNYNVINHKDANKRNNRAENLEWVDHKGNSAHAVQNSLNTACKKVINYDDDNNILGIYLNCADASRKLNANHCIVIRCCKGTAKYYGVNKLKFKYLDATDDIVNMKIISKPIFITKRVPVRKIVEVYDRNGNLLEICKTKIEAAKKYKVIPGTVLQHCLNKVKNPNSKYIFKHAN